VFSSKTEKYDEPVTAAIEAATLRILNDFVTTAQPDISFTAQLGSRNADLYNPNTGPAVTTADTTLPSWISWTMESEGISVDIRVWLSDQALQTEYDEHELRVIPPVPNVMDLAQGATYLKTALAKQDITTMLESISVAKGSSPPTAQSTIKLNWYDTVTGESLVLTWVLLEYGRQAAVRENQMVAIRDFLLSTTGRSPEYWQERVPDIIVNATLTLVPVWDAIAIASSVATHYAYSSVMSPSSMASALAKRFPSGVDANLLDNARWATTHFKALGFVAFPDGPGSSKSFSDLYPDYAIIPLNESNNGLLTSKTRNAIASIEQAIRIAEKDNGGGELPTGFQRLEEFGLVYITYIVDGVNHRVMTLQSYTGA